MELFFGNPFEPEKLPYSFWSTFEASLDKLDDQQINLFFGKDSQGLKGIKKSAINAQRILRKAFCDWIETIHIEEKETGYQFGDNCLFINFNYTDTLVKCFKVCEDNIYHIHGSASHRDSIIFGHATHPEYALAYMKELGGRLEGLFHVEEALYYLDKHVGDNYTKLCEFIALHEAMMDEVMFRMADDPYYHMSLEERMHLEMAAVRRRYWCEQQQRDEEEERKFFRKVKAEMKRRGVSISNEQKEKDQRQEKIQKCMDAPSWHISFYSDADRLRIEQVMKKAGCEKYELYDTIDDCISCFKLV